MAKKKTRRKHARSGSDDYVDLEVFLKAFNLAIKKVPKDGNCLFRAVADQLEGQGENHQKYRDQAVEHLIENKDEFANFFDEEETFDKYISRMSKPGHWGGHLEIHSLSIVNKVNVLIHQTNGLAHTMVNFPRDAKCIQLSYHNQDHFNSVRLSEDPKNGAPTLSSVPELYARMDRELPNDVKSVSSYNTDGATSPRSGSGSGTSSEGGKDSVRMDKDDRSTPKSVGSSDLEASQVSGGHSARPRSAKFALTKMRKPKKKPEGTFSEGVESRSSGEKCTVIDLEEEVIDLEGQVEEEVMEVGCWMGACGSSGRKAKKLTKKERKQIKKRLRIQHVKGPVEDEEASAPKSPPTSPRRADEGKRSPLRWGPKKKAAKDPCYATPPSSPQEVKSPSSRSGGETSSRSSPSRSDGDRSLPHQSSCRS